MKNLINEKEILRDQMRNFHLVGFGELGFLNSLVMSFIVSFSSETPVLEAVGYTSLAMVLTIISVSMTVKFIKVKDHCFSGDRTLFFFLAFAMTGLSVLGGAHSAVFSIVYGLMFGYFLGVGIKKRKIIIDQLKGMTATENNRKCDC